MRSGRPRGPEKALKNVGAKPPTFFKASGAGQTSKMEPNKFGQTAFRYPDSGKVMSGAVRTDPPGVM